MMIYLILFAILLILTFSLEEKIKTNKLFFWLWAIIIILIISIFSGLRDYSVGTDVLGYGIRYFKMTSNYPSLVQLLASMESDYLYFVLNYISSLISDSPHFFLFFIMLFDIFILMKITNKNKNKITIYIFLISYLLLWFNASLNILRQTPAMLLLLYAFTFLEDRKYLKYFLLVIIACLFHSTAIIGFIIFIINIFINRKNKKIRSFIIIFLLGIVAIFFKRIILVLINMGILSSHFIAYLQDVGNFNIYCGILFVLLGIILLIFSVYSKNKYCNNFLLLSIVIQIVFYWLSMSIPFIYRLSYYFLPYEALLISRIDHDIMINQKKYLWVYRIMVLVLLIIIWIFRTKYYDGTLPFRFYFN